MKRSIIFIILALFIFNFNPLKAQSDELVNTCALNIGNATYLKDFKIKLQSSNVNPPSVKFSVVLNKGTIYQLNVCESPDYPGKAVIQLLDNNQVIGSNMKADGSLLKGIIAQIQKTGVYNIVVSFKDGKEGAAAVILSFMK